MALILPLDVTVLEAVENIVRAVQQHFERIDVLVNNAGYGYRAAVEEGDEKEASLLFNTNFWRPVALVKAVLPGIKANRSGARLLLRSHFAL